MDLLSRRRPRGAGNPFVPVGVTNRDKMVLFVPVDRPGIKGHSLLSRPGVPGWKTGTILMFCSSDLGQKHQHLVPPPKPSGLKH